MQMAIGLLVFSLIGILLGCASYLVQPTPEDVQWAMAQGHETTLQELQQGRTLYVQKCAGCHNLHRPDEYAPEEWDVQLDEMTQEEDVVLSPEQRELIGRYLMVASARVRNTASPAPDDHL